MKLEHETLEQPVDESPEITLKLERYEDIFSDFDMRPYSHRALSVDFLGELRRASFEKESEGINIVLNMPSDKRNEASETKIKERLKDHFKKHYEMLVSQKVRTVRRGAGMVAMGVASMLAASYIHSVSSDRNLPLSFLVVLLEPAAWFLLWEGMYMMIFSTKETFPQRKFYKKMSEKRNKIRFGSY